MSKGRWAGYVARVAIQEVRSLWVDHFGDLGVDETGLKAMCENVLWIGR